MNTRTQTMEDGRELLEGLIEQWESLNDVAADLAGDLAWEHAHGELTEDDGVWLGAEYRLLNLEDNMDSVAKYAVEVAMECVPVAAIFTLPMWLRIRMFGPQS